MTDIYEQHTYEQRLKDWQRGKFCPPPDPPLTPVQPTCTVMVAMRDGVKLYTEIFLPNTQTPVPVIFNRSPYPYNRPSKHDSRPISAYLKAGYAFVFQMTRGQYHSEGEFHWHQSDRKDGYDSINWIADQSWCDGNVGMEGISYCGKVQLQAAHAKPSALKCIMPAGFIGNFVSCYPFVGGVPARALWLQLHSLVDAEKQHELDADYGDMSVLHHPTWGPALRKRPLIEAADEVLSGNKRDSWLETISHPTDDEFWQPAHSTDEELAQLDLPIFFTDGWYDPTLGPIDFFTRMERLCAERGDRYLLVGPWNHYQVGTSRLHQTSTGVRATSANSTVDLMALRLAFFDRYLKGDASVNVQTDPVRIYITGLNEWRGYSTYPVPGTQWRELYLQSDGNAQCFPEGGQLSWQPPQTQPADHYVYDPSLPTPSPPGTLVEPIQDCRELEIRGDVLIYTSEPLAAPLTLLGDIKLILHAASDGLDTDWFANLTEVFPDGRSIPFHSKIGALRARFRQGFDREVLLTPNEPTQFSIPLGPAGHQLAPGNRLRLSIRSAYFPQCDANTNTGNCVLTDTKSRIATQTVFHDRARPSHLRLPIVEKV